MSLQGIGIMSRKSFSRIVSEIYDNSWGKAIILRNYLTDTKKSLDIFSKDSKTFVKIFGDMREYNEDTGIDESDLESEEERDWYIITLDQQQLRRFNKEMRKHRVIVEHYPNMLMDMAFIYLVSLFDAYMVDIFAAVLNLRPETLKSSSKTLSYDKIIDLMRDNKIISYLVQREINEISYGSILEQNKYYQSRFNINLEGSGVGIDLLSEIKARRNIIVHNNGVVNAIYLQSVKNPVYKEGDRVDISVDYWNDSFTNLDIVAKYIKVSIINKFAKKSKSQLGPVKT